MNVLVTGGAGYIGSATVERLVERGHEVVVLDDLSTGYRGAVPPEAAFVLGDVADGERVAFAVLEHEVEAIIHCATLYPNSASESDPLMYFERNTLKTLSLLKTLIKYGVKKFVFSSTATVFGRPDSLPIDDDTPVQPENAYSESIYLIERILPWLNQVCGMRYASLRYFNAVGVSKGTDKGSPPGKDPIVQALHKVQKAYTTPDGAEGNALSDDTSIRDYLHVLDVAEAHVLALEALKATVARSYNFGNDRGFSDEKVLAMCRSVVQGASLEPEPLLAFVPLMDSTRASQGLGWRPSRSTLEAIVTSAWSRELCTSGTTAAKRLED